MREFLGLDKIETFKKFASRVKQSKKRLNNFIGEM